jgi:alkylation response protein AidB-like acyl-CoA dehydrogenase
VRRGEQKSVLFEEEIVEPGFRHEVADWLAQNFPAELAYRNPTAYFTDGALADRDVAYQTWLKRVVARGWGAITWPKTFGGGGLGTAHERIIHEEMARIGAWDPNRSYAMMMLGPTILLFGTDDQKARFLPPIARGQHRWCQGFSEPGAGSDLASLQTKCEDRGDHWLVNGQKIWTSGANHADWCFCLVRTDTTHKQRGISFLLIDMASPGVNARPIHLISGSTHFCEVFLTDVRVPKANMLGAVNSGWTVAKRLLQFERDSLTTNKAEMPGLAPLAKQYRGTDEHGRIADFDLRQRLVANSIRQRALSQTVLRAAAEIRAGQGPGPAVSAMKNLSSDVSQERAELVVEIMGQSGLGWEGEGFDSDELAATRHWLHSRAYSIFGGTREIQNNITSKAALGLLDSQ